MHGRFPYTAATLRIRLLRRDFAPDKVSLIFTLPPYDRQEGVLPLQSLHFTSGTFTVPLLTLTTVYLISDDVYFPIGALIPEF
jgi:hypothetical protein